MRLAAQEKLGFYPIPPAALATALERLAAPAGDWSLLDPCAGEGAAAAQLAAALGCPHVHAIELDEARAARCREALPGAQVLGPCSLFGAAVSMHSLGLLYLNPPFDDALEGGRTEGDFLAAAGHWLKPGGVLVLVCPERVAGNWTVSHLLRENYEQVAIVPFPEDCRRFDEVFVFGVKRRESLPYYHATADEVPPAVYQIPAGAPPRTFRKAQLTDAELTAALGHSPLRKHLQAPATTALASPPLALGTGHIALLLASGHLDGLVKPRGERPHVVRGTARKVEYVSGVIEETDAKGLVKTTTVVSQKIQLIVKVLLADGTLKTFGDEEVTHADPA